MTAILLEMGAGSCVYNGAVYKEEWLDGPVLKFFDSQQLNVKKSYLVSVERFV
jgi:hypothetical protein